MREIKPTLTFDEALRAKASRIKAAIFDVDGVLTDGRIYIEQWKQGHITLKTLFGYSGDGWKRQTTQWLEELAWKKAEMQRLGLTREDLPVSSISMSMNTDTTTGEPQAHNSDLELDDDL